MVVYFLMHQMIHTEPITIERAPYERKLVFIHLLLFGPKIFIYVYRPLFIMNRQPIISKGSHPPGTIL